MSHVYRSFAVEQARAAGYVGFRTSLTKEGMWRCHYEPGGNPADELARDLEWAHHGEVAWVPNVGDPEKTTRVGVLVVNVTREELDEFGEVTKDHTRPYVWIRLKGEPIKTCFLVEPLTPSLWEPERSEPAARRQEASPYGRSPRPTEERERSSAESPVKTVWRICGEMAEASRAEIVNACVAAGVNKSTAGTQYYHWKKAREAGAK